LENIKFTIDASEAVPKLPLTMPEITLTSQHKPLASEGGTVVWFFIGKVDTVLVPVQGQALRYSDTLRASLTYRMKRGAVERRRSLERGQGC
jgi:hypothetical protein